MSSEDQSPSEKKYIPMQMPTQTVVQMHIDLMPDIELEELNKLFEDGEKMRDILADALIRAGVISGRDDIGMWTAVVYNVLQPDRN
jgi:hypothetical protein